MELGVLGSPQPPNCSNRVTKKLSTKRLLHQRLYKLDNWSGFCFNLRCGCQMAKPTRAGCCTTRLLLANWGMGHTNWVTGLGFVSTCVVSVKWRNQHEQDFAQHDYCWPTGAWSNVCVVTIYGTKYVQCDRLQVRED